MNIRFNREGEEVEAEADEQGRPLANRTLYVRMTPLEKKSSAKTRKLQTETFLRCAVRQAAARYAQQQR